MSVEMLVERIPAEVGARVRTARTLRGWTLDQLAEHSGVSRRMIVNVEAGTSNASIATLLRLATALHVSLADVVSDVSRCEPIVVTGPADREPLWRGSAGGSALLVASADTPDMLELWDWTMQPGDEYESEAHRPGTRELLHVIAGRLRLTVDENNRELGEGEAASFDAGVPHRYANEGKVPLRFMMTVLEPLVRVRP
jgi:transcriptional regulator with XRE-family HTH domain